MIRADMRKSEREQVRKLQGVGSPWATCFGFLNKTKGTNPMNTKMLAAIAAVGCAFALNADVTSANVVG